MKVKCNTVRSIDRCCRINDKSPLIRTYYVGGENLFHLFGGIIVFMFSHPHHLNESLYGVIQERTVNNIHTYNNIRSDDWNVPAVLSGAQLKPTHTYAQTDGNIHRL